MSSSMTANDRRYSRVAICPAAGMNFCKIPVDGQELLDHDKVVEVAKSRLMGRGSRVMIKFSRRQSPGR